jgi:hypothetical protein
VSTNRARASTGDVELAFLYPAIQNSGVVVPSYVACDRGDEPLFSRHQLLVNSTLNARIQGDNRAVDSEHENDHEH